MRYQLDERRKEGREGSHSRGIISRAQARMWQADREEEAAGEGKGSGRAEGN